MDLRTQLIEFEGREHKAYPDPLTGGVPWTIGVGHTGPEVHEGLEWTDEQIDLQLDIDIKTVTEAVLERWPWVAIEDAPRQAVLIGMAFQMGAHGLAGFAHMLSAAEAGHYDAAADEMIDSTWYRQTPKRAGRLVTQMRTGEWS